MHSKPLVREQVYTSVQQIYHELSSIPVERFCERRTECCYFKITGRTPQLTKGEALLAAKAVRAAGRTQLAQRADGGCPLLFGAEKKCLIYTDRPFGCRTHFCPAAGGPYGRREVLPFIHQLEEIDEQLGGSGPLNFFTAMEQALKELR